MPRDEKARHAGSLAADQHDRQKNGCEAEKAKVDEHGNASETKHTTTSQSYEYTPAQIERAREDYADAIEWQEVNPEAWEWAERRFCELGARGRYISVQGILADVRERGGLTFTSRTGEKFGVNHNHAAAFARMLCDDHPEFAHLVRRRRSVMDAIMYGGCEGEE